MTYRMPVLATVLAVALLGGCDSDDDDDSTAEREGAEPYRRRVWG